MIYTGLVSVTFRKLPPQDIVTLVKQAGLQGIEWGGDIHVPHGNTERAREVYKMTQDAGLSVASYGSYYYVGCEEQGAVTFERALETAVALKAPTVRIWAGDRGSRDADEAWWDRVAGESRRIAALAEKAGITVSFEYHDNTLTDTSESACRLMKEINHANIRSYWQIPFGLNAKSRLSSLVQITPWLSNIHVFYYMAHDRKPLADGMHDWFSYLQIVKNIKGDRFCMLEFVKNDSTEQFLRDAETLKENVLYNRLKLNII